MSRVLRRKPGPPKTIIDMTAYMRAYKTRKRTAALAKGLCVHCFAEPARENRKTCAGCAAIPR